MAPTRVQQLFTLCLTSSGLAWAVYCAQQGHLAQAAWACAVLAPHAPVLVLELLWAAHLARSETSRQPVGAATGPVQPFPSLRQWLRAGWQEIGWGILVFGWYQPWAHKTYPDYLPQGIKGRRGVLLVHGYFCNRGFWNRWMPRLREAGIPFVAVSLAWPRADIAAQARSLERARATLEEATGLAPLLVGHSMGGLVLRHWLGQAHDEFALSHQLITIGSPHHGTALAAWAHSPAALQMRIGSDFLRVLPTRETAQRLSRITCYWSLCDNVVLPARHATLAGARNIHLPGLPHVGLAMAQPILDDVLERLRHEGL